MSAVNHEEEHNCPVYGRIISPDLCYDSAMCLTGFFKVESTRELDEISDIKLQGQYVRRANTVIWSSKLCGQMKSFG